MSEMEEFTYTQDTDGSMDGIDDLFYEADPIVQVTATYVPKELLHRLEELSLSGCCQY